MFARRLSPTALAAAALCVLLALHVAAAEEEDHHDEHEHHAAEEEHHDEHHDEGGHDAWAPALGAAAVVSLTNLIGLLVLAATSVRVANLQTKLAAMLSSAFAAGVLVCAALLLILPEALKLADADAHGEEHGEEHEEGENAWQVGLCAMAGMFVLMVVDVAIRHMGPADATAAAAAAAAEAEAAAGDEASGAPPAKMQPPQPADAQVAVAHDTPAIAAAVLFGDAFHNLADGIFIGSAFLSCPSIGWTVVLGTVAHELPQELSDYLVLTQRARLSARSALALNFLSSLSVFLGVVLVLALDVSQRVVGLLLGVGAGVYLYIALAECLPAAFRGAAPTRERLLATGLFALGATLIGLVLLSHVHCDAHGAHDEHADH